MNSRTLWDRIVALMLFPALAGGVLSLSICFYEEFAALNSPRVADPVHGFVVLYDNNGIVHYVTQMQVLWLNLAAMAFVLCASSFLLVLPNQSEHKRHVVHR